MLDAICPGDMPGHAAPQKPGDRASDTALMASHNANLALASALATAAACPRAAVGDFPWPFYFIGTRDCFTYNLLAKSEVSCRDSHALCEFASSRREETQGCMQKQNLCAGGQSCRPQLHKARVFLPTRPDPGQLPRGQLSQ